MTPAEADAILREDADAEEVRIELASDGRAAAFEGANAAALAAARCLRRRGHRSEAQWGQALLWFPRRCAEDEEEYDRRLEEFYPTPEALREAEERSNALADQRERRKGAL